jgi:hypothetical protein
VAGQHLFKFSILLVLAIQEFTGDAAGFEIRFTPRRE